MGSEMCIRDRYVYRLPRGQRHSSCVRACAQTTTTAAPDCNTSSSSSVASRRWSRVLAPQRVNPALAVAVGIMFHTQQQYSSNTVDITLSGNIMQFLLIILRLKIFYISGELGRRSSIMFGFLMPCWYSYSCLLYTSPSPRDLSTSRMPSSA